MSPDASSPSSCSEISIDDIRTRDQDFPPDPLTIRDERTSSISLMLTPPHTPTEDTASASVSSRQNHFYEMEPIRHHHSDQQQQPTYQNIHGGHSVMNTNQHQHYQQHQQRIWLQAHLHNNHSPHLPVGYDLGCPTLGHVPVSRGVLMNQWLQHATIYQQRPFQTGPFSSELQRLNPSRSGLGGLGGPIKVTGPNGVRPKKQFICKYCNRNFTKSYK